MNKRIQSLANEADATVLGTISGGKQYTFLEQDLERFAELIVTECAVIAHANATVDETYDYACHTVAWKIKEHFGVE